MRKRFVILIALAAPLPVLAQTTSPSGTENGGAPVSDSDGNSVSTGGATSGGTDWAAVKAEAEARKAAYEAMEAAAKSQEAATKAKQAATAASIDTVTGQTAITGTVTTTGFTPKAEALLLVTRSTRAAAKEIAPPLKRALAQRAAKKLLILTGTSELATSDAILFDLQLQELKALLALARQHYAAALQADTPRIAVKPDAGGQRSAHLAAAGAVVDALSKLGSYFQSDYTFGNVDVTSTPGLVANALVTALRSDQVANPIVIPSNLIASDAQPLITALAPVQAEHVAVAGEQLQAKDRAAALRKTSGDKAADAAKLYDLADSTATRALAAYDRLLAALVADPSEGKEALAVRIIRQKAVQAQLAGDPLILLLSSKDAAAFYTRKNLWTFLGGPPLYTMGGVSLTYTLYERQSGLVLAGGTVGKHGGYRSVGAVERLFK